MNSKSTRVLFGIGLIFLGVLFFVQQIFHISIGNLIIAGLFLLGGVTFFYVFARNNEHWWALIPGFTLAGIGGLIAMGDLIPRFNELFGGAFFLAMIGASFLVIYIMHREFWWAIIPAGVLFTLALVTIVSPYNGSLAGAVFFFGLAATFGVIGLMHVGKAEKWPWIPAGICALLGLIVLATSGALVNSVFGYVWPAILLVVGVYLIIRSIRKQQ